MCGRFVITNAVFKTKKIVKISIKVEDTVNYNCHPSQKLPVIKRYINGNTLENLTWGIVPQWAKKKDFKPLINARLETINEKISFKKLIKSFRCIVVADGYYEWKKEHNSKTPFYLTREDNKTSFFAGIFEKNQFCILTQNSSGIVTNVHQRQPVILREKDISAYLNLKTEASNFLNNYKSPNLVYYQISKDVNNPKNNNESLIQKI